jgi:hypothetical protein
MALVQCPECKQEISDQAQACPHCGAPRPGVVAHTAQPAPVSQVAPSRTARGAWPIILVFVLALGAVLLYRMNRPALERAGVVASARFAIDNAGANEDCTVLGDYCLRVRCAVTNIGDASGISQLAADLEEDSKVIATHRATSRMLDPGQHDTLTLDFPEATLASTAHQYRCYSGQ